MVGYDLPILFGVSNLLLSDMLCASKARQVHGVFAALINISFLGLCYFISLP